MDTPTPELERAGLRVAIAAALLDGKPLRAYQQRAVEAVRESMRAGHRHVILQLATGAGKTRIGSEILKLMLARDHGARGLFIAPRRELVKQAAAAIADLGISVSIIMADEPSTPDAQVQVASFDTLSSRHLRAGTLDLPPATIVIVDEAHLAMADRKQAILRHYASRFVIGLTATPARADGRPLGDLFDAIVFGPSIPELVALGYLVPIRYFAPSRPDLQGVRIVRGDYQQRSLSERMSTPGQVRAVVENWIANGEGRSTVAFCVGIEHSQKLCRCFKRAGIKAEHVDAHTRLEEREAIFARVASGETTVLCNALIATFGLDIPRLSCVILARPTRDVVLYLQTVGRGLRPSPETGKVNTIVFDHAGAVAEHGFVDRVHPWTLKGGKKIKDLADQLSAERADKRPMTCPHCHMVVSGLRKCPNCGTLLVQDGEPLPLYALDGNTEETESLEQQQTKHYATTLAFCQARGYNPGWVAHRFRSVFGIWPPASFKSIKPAWASNTALVVLKRSISDFKQAKEIERAQALGLYGGQAWKTDASDS